jgi:phospho-N-acetylmuramoyl-pentapeptide-transferase
MYYELFVLLILTGLGIIAGKFLIPFLHKLKFGQTVREEGPESHKTKTGTPTMGGILFFIMFLLGGIIFGSGLLFGAISKELWFMIVFSLVFGLIGFADDFLIILKKNNQGLNAKSKLLLIILAALSGTWFYLNVLNYSTVIGLEKFGFSVDLGYFYYVFAIILIAGTTNAVNLTDGIDGLSSSVTVVAALFYFIYGQISENYNVVVFTILLLSSCLAFLYYNWNPARVFMGDTGSLLLGGALAALAMTTKTEILLPLVGGVFVLETLSVIGQVFSYKMFKKRIFKMSPIHHHFELSGWKEKKIVVIFSGVGFIFLILSLILI